MSDILIKDMEMPKKPGAYSMKIRLFVKEDGTASIWGLEEYIPHEPLDVIPVPPHGRLIDADALKQKIFSEPIVEDADDPRFNLYAKVQVAGAVNKIIEAVDDAPAIIPARAEGGA